MKLFFLENLLSIKEFKFELRKEYQSFKLMAGLHLTRKKFFFVLENFKLIKKFFDSISKTLFIPYLIPKFVSTPQQNSLFLYFASSLHFSCFYAVSLIQLIAQNDFFSATQQP